MGVWLRHLVDSEIAAEGGARLFARCDDSLAERDLSEERANVGRFHNLEEGIRSVVFVADNTLCRIIEGDALLGKEAHDFLLAKRMVLNVNEMVLVPEPYLPFDSPVIVDKVRVIEIHTPAFPLGRKASEEKNFGVFGKERSERMMFDGWHIE